MTLSDFIEELNIAIRQDGHDIYCNASTAEIIKGCLMKQNRMNKDTIYRQDAINAFWKLEAELRPSAIDAVLDMLKNLPSVQPERTCVNCGRTVNNGGWYADGRTRCPIEEHYALPKDGYCHLWENRNVTDDDYPERRTDERFNQQTGGD